MSATPSKPKPVQGAGGRFVSTRPATPRPAGSASIAAGAVEREHKHWLSGGGMRALPVEFTRARNRRATEIIGNVESSHQFYSLLQAEAREYVLAEAQLAAVDAYILTLGDRVIDKKRRKLHQLMADRRQMAEHLGAQRTRIAQLKNAVDLEARIAALEGARNV